jgi:hypothetical protein
MHTEAPSLDTQHPPVQGWSAPLQQASPGLPQWLQWSARHSTRAALHEGLPLDDWQHDSPNPPQATQVPC